MAGLFRHNSPTRIYPLEYFHLKLLYHPRAFPNSSMRLFSRQSCQLCATPQTAAHQALGSSAHGFFQARIQEWVAISCCRGSSWPRDQTHISCTAGRFFTTEPPLTILIVVWNPGELYRHSVKKQIHKSPWPILQSGRFFLKRHTFNIK